MDTRPRLAGARPQRWRGFQPGDLVLPSTGYPQLCEVVRIEPDGLIRIKGLQWAPGYTVLVHPRDYRLVTGRLSR